MKKSQQQKNRQKARELIGGRKTVSYRTTVVPSSEPAIDWKTVDYKYWDKARRGQIRGLEIGGLFIKPLCSKIAAWVLGESPTWEIPEGPMLDEFLKWWKEQSPKILHTYEESLNLADMYLIVHPDLTITAVSPDVVEPILDEKDWSLIIGWRITQNYSHPEHTGSRQQVVDEYYADKRYVTVYTDGNPGPKKRFNNPIGMIPIIHIPNQLGVDEVFGRPEAEALLYALTRYDSTMKASLDGNYRQGRPTPVVSKLGSITEVKKFWERFGEEQTIPKNDGTTETIRTLKFDADQFLTLSGEAEFDYKSPGSFSGDTEVLLGLIFYLILQHTEVVEFVWGNAIQGSKASSDSQMAPFVKWITKKRSRVVPWLTQIAQVALRYMAIRNLQKIDDSTVMPAWSPLTEKDGRLMLDTVMAALDKGLLRNETALRKLPLDIQNVSDEVKGGQEEKMARDEAALKQAQAARPPTSQSAA